MKKSLLIADSGGTTTDWCFINTNGERTYFSSESYHYANFNNAFFDRMNQFWKEKDFNADTEIHFYGAGCSLEQNQRIIANHFKDLGFQNILVENDLLGACRGLLRQASGLLGILGTGSALAEYDKDESIQIYGGFGYLIGDEGSGFYFGKLLIHNLLNKKLSIELSLHLHSILGDEHGILEHIYGANGKKWIGELAALVGNSDEIQTLHRENIRLFLKLHLSQIKKKYTEISFVGSYAFHQKDILIEELKQYNLTLRKIAQKPIEEIVDFTVERYG
jgi:glucosamine kinase